MTVTPTRPLHRPGFQESRINGAPSEEVVAEREKMLGVEKADALLGSVYLSGSTDASGTLFAAAEAATKYDHPREASLYRLVALTPDYITAQKDLNAVRRSAHQLQSRNNYVLPSTGETIRKLRNQLFPFNAALKEYLDYNSTTSLVQTTAMLTRCYSVMLQKAGLTPYSRTDVYADLMCTARGMRAELAAEQILGKFEDVEIHHHLHDDTQKREQLDAEGTDYVLTVKALGKAFDIGVDIKAHPDKTIDKYGDALPGKLWSQCQDSDFVDGSSRIDSKKISRMYGPMQDDLINQIILQYPGQLETLCRNLGITLDDIDIN